MAVSSGYIANQNKRWLDANTNKDTDLMNRLTADSKRAGYTLTPYSGASTGVQSGAGAVAVSQPFDLGKAYENNQKMQYRQQGIDALKPVEPFKMDLASIQSDPTYQAAMASAKDATQVAEGDISAAMNRRGIMDSTINANAASNAAQQEYGRVNRELLPRLIEDQYKRYIDQNNMNRQYASDLFGVSDMYGNDEVQNFNNAITESSVTGSYMPPGAREAIDKLNALKATTEQNWMAMTPEERAAARKQGDNIRLSLQAFGVDPDKFGANVSSSQATKNIGSAGIKTMASQAQDLQNKQANLNAAVTVGNQTGNIVAPQDDWNGLYRQAADGGLGQTLDGQQVASGLVTEQQQRDLATRQSALQEWQTTGFATPAVSAALGVPEGTPTSDEAYRQASITLDQDKFTYAQMADASKANTPDTVTAATAGDMLGQALQKVVGIDDEGKQKYGVISDPTAREEAFVNMINTTSLRGNDVVTALTKAGYSIKEINALQKEYPEVFQ